MCGTIISGTDEEGKPFILVEPQAGGWGAGATKDGESGMVVVGDGETYIMPVEVCESRYPLLVDLVNAAPVVNTVSINTVGITISLAGMAMI